MKRSLNAQQCSTKVLRHQSHHRCRCAFLLVQWDEACGHHQVLYCSQCFAAITPGRLNGMRCRSCTLCSSKLGSEVQQQCRNVSGDIGTGFRSHRWPVSVTGHRWKTKTQRYHNQPDSVCTHKASDTGLAQQSQKNTLCWTGQGKQKTKTSSFGHEKYAQNKHKF